MPTHLDAIYENGPFHPVDDVIIPLVDGTLVRLTDARPPEAKKLSAEEPASQQPKQGNGLAALAGGLDQSAMGGF